MPTIADIRQQYPQYDDMSDEQLARALHGKYYADMPYADFARKISLPQPSGPTSRPVDPNRGKSALQLGLAGAGKFVTDTALGAAQLATAIPAALGVKEAQDEASRLEGLADVRKLDPTLRTKAGRVGYGSAALVPALTAAFIPGANTALGAGAIGATMGAVQPTGAGESRAKNTALSGVTGFASQGVFNAVGRLAQPVTKALSASEQRAVDLLKSKGVALSAGQQTGSKAVQAVERTLGDIPASAGKMIRQGERFRDSYTRAVLRTIGENADGATPEVLDRALTRIGSVMDDVASKYDLDVTGRVTANELNRIERRAAEELLNDNRIGVQIAKIREAAQQNGGKLSGKAYANVKTTLDNLSKQQNIGPIAFELRQALDDALQTAAKGTDDFARLGKARAQYRNLQAIAAVADTTANGRVSPAALASHLKSSKYTRNSMRFNRGDAELARLARAGSTVVDRFPQSGTAPRAMAQLMLPAGVGAGAYALSDDPEKALKIAAATWLLPKAGGALFGNPAAQNYLASGIAQPAVRNALLTPSRIGLGAAVPAYLLSQQ